MHYYEKLTEVRKSRGLFQSQIAQVLGITQQQYQLYESGKREIPLHLIVVLADFYGLSIDYLVGREEPQSEDCGNVG